MSKLKGKWLSDFFQNEVPSGTVNGVNVTFTLSSVPYANASLELKLNGRPLFAPTDYSISGSTITMVVPPAFGQELNARYIKKT